MGRLLIALALVACASASVRPDPSPCRTSDGCSEILVGIYSVFRATETSSFSSEVHEWLNSLNRQRIKSLSNIGLRAQVPLAGGGFLPIGFDSSDETATDFLLARSEGRIASISESNAVTVFSKSANPEVVAAWLACKKSAAEQFGLQIVEESRRREGSNGLYLFKLRYQPFPATVPSPTSIRVTSLQVNGVEQLPQPIVLLAGRDEIVSARINDRTDNHLVLKSDFGAIERQLPQIKVTETRVFKLRATCQSFGFGTPTVTGIGLQVGSKPERIWNNPSIQGGQSFEEIFVLSEDEAEAHFSFTLSSQGDTGVGGFTNLKDGFVRVSEIWSLSAGAGPVTVVPSFDVSFPRSRVTVKVEVFREK